MGVHALFAGKEKRTSAEELIGLVLPILGQPWTDSPRSVVASGHSLSDGPKASLGTPFRSQAIKRLNASVRCLVETAKKNVYISLCVCLGRNTSDLGLWPACRTHLVDSVSQTPVLLDAPLHRLTSLHSTAGSYACSRGDRATTFPFVGAVLTLQPAAALRMCGFHAGFIGPKGGSMMLLLRVVRVPRKMAATAPRSAIAAAFHQRWSNAWKAHGSAVGLPAASEDRCWCVGFPVEVWWNPSSESEMQH